VLTAASLAVVGVALILPFTPLGRLFHFEPPPMIFFAWLAGMVLAYLALAEAAKRYFYGYLALGPRRRGGPLPTFKAPDIKIP
jgi:Mg2+-importing ATPase